MPRSIQLTDGRVITNIGDDVTDEEVFNTLNISEDLRPTKMPESFESKDATSMLQEKYGPKDSKNFNEALGQKKDTVTDFISNELEQGPLDLWKVGLSSGRGSARLVTDIVDYFSDEDLSGRSEWAINEVTKSLSKAVGIDPQSVLDERGKLKPTETVTGTVGTLGSYVMAAQMMGGDPRQAANLMGKLARPTLAGFAADQVLTDPDENFFNMMEELPEPYQIEVLEFLAAEETDENMVKRLKLVGEGIVLGSTVAGLLQTPAATKKAIEWFGKPFKKLTDEQKGDFFVRYLEGERKAIIDSGGTIRFQNPEDLVDFHETPQSVDQIIRQRNSRLRRYQQEYFTARGYYTPKAHDAFNDSQYAKRATIAEAEHIANRLNKAINDIVDVTPDNDIAYRANAALTDPEVLKGLPVAVAVEVKNARRLIDEMSKKLLKSNVVSPDLKEIITKNMGTYVRRSYRLYEDAGYQPDPADRRRAVNFLQDRYLKGNPEATPEEALSFAEAKVSSILGEDLSSNRTYYTKAKLVNKAIFKKKGEIAPEIRKLMGEIENAPENIITSVSKVADLYETNRFYDNLHKLGNNKYIFKANKRTKAQKGIFTEKIEGTNTRLDGMYTTPEVAKAIDQTEGRLFTTLSEDTPATNFYRNFLALKGASQASKTVYSHVTHLRNFSGGMQFGIANGSNPFAGSSHANFQILVNNIRREGDAHLDEAYEKMLRLGIINTNVRANEFRELLQLGADTKTGSVIDHISNYAEKIGISRGIQSAPERLYMATDDFFKISAYANELDTLRKAFPDESLTVLEDQAAKIVRDTFPNYDRVPKGIKRLRELPLGNFVAFPAEILRTSTHILRQSSKEITSGNSVLRERGLKRLAGYVGSMGAWYGVAEGTKTAMGWSEEEGRAADILTQSDYSKDSPRGYRRDEDGNIFFNDFQFMDSYSYIKEPILAAYDEIASGRLQGKELDEYLVKASLAGMERALKPFVSPSIFSEAILRVGYAMLDPQGRDFEGKEYFNETTPVPERLYLGLSEVLSSFAPGSYDSVMDAIDAYNEKINKSTGSKRDLGAELVTNFTGVRFQKFEPQNSLMFAAKEYSRKERDLSGMLINYENTPEDLETQYQRRQYHRYRLQQTLHEQFAAAQFFLDDAQIIEALQEAGLQKNDIGFLYAGIFMPEKPSKNDILDLYNKTFSPERNDLNDFSKGFDEATSRLFEMYAEMAATSLITFDPEDMDNLTEEEIQAQEDKVRLLKAEGGLVTNVPNVIPEPDERINPMTGRPYNEPSGFLLDDNDPAVRLGMSKGGQIAKGAIEAYDYIHKNWRHWFEGSDERTIKTAANSLAGNPVTRDELEKQNRTVISFMNSNSGILPKRIEKLGTRDEGNWHEILKVDSPEGQAAIKELGHTPTSDYIVVENMVLQSKDKSPVRRRVARDNNIDELLHYYNVEGLRPLYATKGDVIDWRQIDDGEIYGAELPRHPTVTRNLIDAEGIDPKVVETLQNLIIPKHWQDEFAEAATTFGPDDLFTQRLQDSIRPVARRDLRELNVILGSPEDFVKDSVVKDPVYRIAMGEELNRETLLAFENPREISANFASTPEQSNSIVAKDLSRYRRDPLETEAARVKPDEVTKEFEKFMPNEAGELPEIMEGKAIGQFYLRITNPLQVNGDYSNWDSRIIISEMLEAADSARPITPNTVLERIDDNPNFWMRTGVEDIEAEEMVMEYVDDAVKGKYDPELIDMLDDFGVNVDYIDEFIGNIKTERTKPSALLDALEESGVDFDLDKLRAIYDEPMEVTAGFAQEEHRSFGSFIENEMDLYNTNRAFRDYLSDLGFDGIAYRNTSEATSMTGSDLSYLPFSSEQIKSASATVFDSSDPRLGRAMGGLVRLRKAKGGEVDDPSMYRSDGSKKSARGYLGPVVNKIDGRTMTEVSIGVESDGKEMFIPTMVPTLTPEEVEALANMEVEGNARAIPESIVKKAIEHARKRIKEGKDPFYQDGEDRAEFTKGGSVKVPKPPTIPEANPTEIQPMNISVRPEISGGQQDRILGRLKHFKDSRVTDQRL
jgi:hypothetical protein